MVKRKSKCKQATNRKSKLYIQLQQNGTKNQLKEYREQNKQKNKYIGKRKIQQDTRGNYVVLQQT